MKIKYYAIALILGLSTISHADSIESLSERSDNSATILNELVNLTDNAIPISLLEKSVCIATFPGVIRAGFIFGGRYGKGLVSCRTSSGWSLPSYIKVIGGSWGLQIGIESIDLVLVFVSSSAVEKFSKDNFTVGVDATVAIGPIGRDAHAGTDYKLDSEIYSYSRARGLFAGLTIQGAGLVVSHSDNETVYGNTSAATLLTSDGRVAPSTVSSYVKALELTAH
jgi:lipid-binding SYLF domain-containing protein